VQGVVFGGAVEFAGLEIAVNGCNMKRWMIVDELGGNLSLTFQNMLPSSMAALMALNDSSIG
jgi:hypothetical protein